MNNRKSGEGPRPLIINIRIRKKISIRALRHQFIIPDFLSFTKYIDEFYDTASKCTEGKNPDYIPQLAKLDPDLFGVAICTVDGQRYHLGDSKES